MGAGEEVTDAPTTRPMTLLRLVTEWRPGSFDWTWPEEYEDVMARPETAAIRARVDAEGIGFLDHIAPILLGSDGRVWDGHHRICIAMERGIRTVRVERAVER